MSKKNIKTYEQYAVDYELSKGFAQTQLTDNDISDSQKRIYERRYLNYLLMMDVADDFSNESSVDDVIEAFKSNDFDNDAKNFYDSFNKSKRLSYLTPYTVEDMNFFKTYKLRGYNIGFAIKNNGDIVLVHNNEDNVKGIGDLMIKKAIDLGGDHLDHFDGYLTGYYKRNGFSLRNNEVFNDEYAPEKWHFKPVNIYDKDDSIYADELTVKIDSFKKAEKRYDSGRPDVVYRNLN